MEPSIVLYEPQCTGYSHANFNAALLRTALLAYPEATVAFSGEPEHVRWVRDALEQHLGTVPDRVVWVGTQIPTRQVLRPGGLAQHRRACSELLRQVARFRAELLVLCSLSSLGLHALKRALSKAPPSVPVLGVFHGALSALSGTRSRNPVDWWFTPRRALDLAHPPGLRYIALGASILRSLESLVPQHSRRFSALDVPTLWEALPNQRSASDPVRFAYFGVGRTGLKGFELFCRLAADLEHAVRQGRCEFVLVGFVRGATSTAIDGLRTIRGISSSPLPPDEYRRRAASATYAIWPGQADQYVLRASASFVDTLCMGRPGICLRAPFIEDYCFRMGDIGFLCDGYEQMLQTATSVVNEFPHDRYRQQCANVLSGGRVFHPDALAPSLRAIVDVCRQELAEAQ